MEALIEIYAKTPVAKIRSSEEYKRLCQREAGKGTFDADRNLVEKAKVQVETYLKDGQTTREQARAALCLLIKARRTEQDRDLLHRLLVKGYRPGWTRAQRGYFDKAWRKICLKYDIFFSFTTRYPNVAGDNPINTAYRYFIVKELSQETWKGADRQKENLLAKAVYRLIVKSADHNGFFFPDSEFDNSMTEQKLREACRNSMVFVQLIQNIMFHPPQGKKNYCFFEYTTVADLLESEPDKEDRILFVVAHNRQDLLPTHQVHLEYDIWHGHVLQKDPPYLPEADSAAGSSERYSTIKQLLQERVRNKVVGAWQQILNGVPE